MTCNFDNFDKQKATFYLSTNCIFAILGPLNNAPVTLHLMHSIALPTLTYALEALCLNKTQLISLDHPWTRMFLKLFKTFYLSFDHSCQYFSDLLPIRHAHSLRRMGSLRNLETSHKT